MSIETARECRTGKRDGVIITLIPQRFRVRYLTGKRKYKSKWFTDRCDAEKFADSWTSNNILLTT